VKGEGKTISIYDWFDPHDLKHLRAYRQLQTTGCWPEDFPPDHVELGTGWQMLITHKMADAWVDEKLKGVEEKDARRTSRGNLEPGV
jgi:hypothetical protein